MYARSAEFSINNQSFRQPIWPEKSWQSSTKISPLKYMYLNLQCILVVHKPWCLECFLQCGAIAYLRPRDSKLYMLLKESSDIITHTLTCFCQMQFCCNCYKNIVSSYILGNYRCLNMKEDIYLVRYAPVTPCSSLP